MDGSTIGTSMLPKAPAFAHERAGLTQHLHQIRDECQEFRRSPPPPGIARVEWASIIRATECKVFSSRSGIAPVVIMDGGDKLRRGERVRRE